MKCFTQFSGEPARQGHFRHPGALPENDGFLSVKTVLTQRDTTQIRQYYKMHVGSIDTLIQHKIQAHPRRSLWTIAREPGLKDTGRHAYPLRRLADTDRQTYRHTSAHHRFPPPPRPHGPTGSGGFALSSLSADHRPALKLHWL